MTKNMDILADLIYRIHHILADGPFFSELIYFTSPQEKEHH